MAITPSLLIFFFHFAEVTTFNLHRKVIFLWFITLLRSMLPRRFNRSFICWLNAFSYSLGLVSKVTVVRVDWTLYAINSIYNHNRSCRGGYINSKTSFTIYLSVGLCKLSYFETIIIFYSCNKGLWPFLWFSLSFIWF